MKSPEKLQFKILYRKAIQICHPDRTPPHLHSFMAEKAKQLNAAKNAEDYARIRQIAAELGVAEAAENVAPSEIRHPPARKKWNAAAAVCMLFCIAAAVLWNATYRPAKQNAAAFYSPNLETGGPVTQFNRGVVLLYELHSEEKITRKLNTALTNVNTGEQLRIIKKRRNEHWRNIAEIRQELARLGYPVEE